jgi:hypothetical protein
MGDLLLWIGRLAGGAGAVLALAAFTARAMSTWLVANIHVGTMLQAGTALMVLGTLSYAAWMAERR